MATANHVITLAMRIRRQEICGLKTVFMEHDSIADGEISSQHIADHQRPEQRFGRQGGAGCRR